MAVIKELIRKEDDGTLSFGNYEFDTKQKLSDFEEIFIKSRRLKK